MRRIDRDPLGESGNAGAKIGRHLLNEHTDVDLLKARWSPDSLEPVCHSFQSLQIAVHVRERALGHWITARFSQQFDPAAHARDWRSELVRRLARHPGPDLFTISPAARFDTVHTCEKEHPDEQRLQQRNDSQSAHEWRIAKMNCSNIAFSNRWILAIELSNELLDVGRIHRKVARKIRRRGGMAF